MFRLSDEAFREAASVQAHDFVFVVGGVEYPCYRFQACAVSKRVRDLVRKDCYISRLCLDIKDEGRRFQEVMRLMEGKAISVTPENCSFLEECARALDSDELLRFISASHIENEEISLSNVVERINIKTRTGRDYQSELDFLASHFLEADVDNVLKRLSAADLRSILTNALLKLECEDQLYDIIISLGRNGRDYLGLLRHVDCPFLSGPKLKNFLHEIFPEMRGDTVWAMICECVCRFCKSGVKWDLMKAGLYRIEEFTSAAGPFNGIVCHLRNQCGGNPHTKGVIAITCSSTIQKFGQPYQLIDYGWNGYWATESDPSAFVQLDFKSRSVCLSHYSIQSVGGNAHHLLSWVVEVSDDGLTWEVVDERNTAELACPNDVVKTYACNKGKPRFARIVRLRRTGKDSNGYDCLVLRAIELFGKLTFPIPR